MRKWGLLLVLVIAVFLIYTGLIYAAATDIDIGDYEKEMVIGNSQVISAAVIPSDSTDNCSYSSSNSSVATVNQTGRVTAISAGTVNITVTAGAIKKILPITVKEEAKVTEIDIGDYNKTMKVGDKQTISVTTYPSDVKNAKIYYSSSNVKVLTVSSSGQIVAKGNGEATVSISSGSAKATINIGVSETTAGLDVNTYFVTLKPKQKYHLSVTVSPGKALQKIAYSTNNGKVAGISKNGTITAKQPGHTSIVVTNGDLTQIVTVVVNTDGDYGTEYMMSGGDVETVIKKASGSSVDLKGKYYHKVSGHTLNTLASSGKNLRVVYDDYKMKICGNDIKNSNNTLDTDIGIDKGNGYMRFNVNDGNSLPGNITVVFNKPLDYEYLYLYNKAKDKYQKLKFTKGERTIFISEGGKYLLTNEEQNKFKVWKWWIISAGCVLAISVVAYVVVRKRYWFW